MHFALDITKAFSPEAFDAAKFRMTKALMRQTKDRIVNGGDDELRFAPLDFLRPDGSQDHPLHHTGGYLLKSLGAGYDSTMIWVGSKADGALVHQEGTVGKGGTLPSIVPREHGAPATTTGGFALTGKQRAGNRQRKRRALFIPLSTKAANMTDRQRNAPRAAVLQWKKRQERAAARLSALQDRRKKAKGRSLASIMDRVRVLKEELRGIGDRLRQERQHAIKAGGLEYGKDFILVKKVDIRPRPYLRLTRENLSELSDAFMGKHRYYDLGND